MPVPNPKADEDQDAYVNRCMSWAADEHPEMDEDQRLAMCFSTFRESKGLGITKVELIKHLRFAAGRLMKMLGDS